jgi:hypothetical protein
MSGPEHDPEFEDFLKRRSPMHRRLDFDDAEPPPELDRLVLNRAREAIQTPERPPIYRATRWAMPVGLAATILLAFTFVLHVGRHEFSANKSVAAPATAVTQVEAAAPAAPAVDAVAEAGSSHGETPARDAYGSADAGAEVASAPRLAKRVAGPHPEPSGAFTAQSEPETAAMRAEADVSADSAARPLSDHALTPTPALAGATAPARASVSRADPESWLREIRRLRDEGRAAEADRELDAFRREFPRHPGHSLAKQPTK